MPKGEGDKRLGNALKRMMYKMNSESWYSVIDNPDLKVDITKKFNGNSITASDLISPYYFDPTRDIYFKITGIERVGDDLYNISRVQVDTKGNEIQNGISENEVFFIDNTFALWNALGGEWSMSIQDGRLIADESSTMNVAMFGNNVGFVRSKENPVGMEFIREDES